MAIELQVRYWPRKEFYCFLFPNREPKEDGGRNATNPPKMYKSACELNSVLVRGSCRLPRFMAAPGPVKSAVKNSPGNQQENNRIDAGGDLGK